MTELYAIEWEKSGGVDLYDMNTLYKDQAIVAIQLTTNGKRYKHLSFELSVLGIDHRNGKVIQGPIEKITPPRSEKRFPYNDDYKLTTQFIEKNTKKAGKDMLVTFSLSGSKTDVSQNVVPFINTQDSMVIVLSAPLSGLGLIYLRYIKNSGGFLAPKILTYDYESNLNAESETDSYDRQAYYEDLYGLAGQDTSSDFIEA